MVADQASSRAFIESTPRSLGFKLRSLQLAYKRMFGQMTGPDGIPMNQIGALSIIYRNQGITPGDLAVMLTIEAAHLTAIIKQLEKRGMIRREKSPTDSRSHSLFTTAAGSAEFLRVQGVIADVEHMFIASVLKQDEVGQLSSLLDRLLTASRNRDRSSGG